MGRLRIKKKEAVLPFRETLAYRAMLILGSVALLGVAVLVMIGALRANVTISFIISAVVGVAAAFAIFYNIDHFRSAKIPQRTLKRMRRR